MADQQQQTFYKTTMVIEILGDRPYTGDIHNLAYEITDGDFSGTVLSEETVEVDGPQMARLLIAQGSDPDFLGLTEDGQPTGDYTDAFITHDPDDDSQQG